MGDSNEKDQYPGIYARVKYSQDGRSDDVSINFFKAPRAAEADFRNGKPKATYLVFWSPRRNETPETYLKKFNMIVDMDKVCQTLKKKADRTGWYEAEVMSFSLVSLEDLLRNVGDNGDDDDDGDTTMSTGRSTSEPERLTYSISPSPAPKAPINARNTKAHKILEEAARRGNLKRVIKDGEQKLPGTADDEDGCKSCSALRREINVLREDLEWFRNSFKEVHKLNVRLQERDLERSKRSSNASSSKNRSSDHNSRSYHERRKSALPRSPSTCAMDTVKRPLQCGSTSPDCSKIGRYQSENNKENDDTSCENYTMVPVEAIEILNTEPVQFASDDTCMLNGDYTIFEDCNDLGKYSPPASLREGDVHEMGLAAEKAVPTVVTPVVPQIVTVRQSSNRILHTAGMNVCEEEYNKVEVPNTVKSIAFDDFCSALKGVKAGKEGDSQFVKNVASRLWPGDLLAERSSAGRACANLDRSPKKECSPDKKQYLMQLMKFRLRSSIVAVEEAEAGKRASEDNVKAILRSKIQTTIAAVKTAQAKQAAKFKSAPESI